MKPHRILKSFPGNQTGNGPTEYFIEGEVKNLSDGLADVAVRAGLAELFECPEEVKSGGDAPANKAKKAAPQNKSKK